MKIVQVAQKFGRNFPYVKFILGDVFTNSSEPGSWKIELRRTSEFELSWVVQLVNHFLHLAQTS
jgi:hypothetical protein